MKFPIEDKLIIKYKNVLLIDEPTKYVIFKLFLLLFVFKKKNYEKKMVKWLMESNKIKLIIKSIIKNF